MKNKMKNLTIVMFALLIVGLIPTVDALGIIQDVEDFSDIDNKVIELTTKESYTSHNIRIPNNDNIDKIVEFEIINGEEVATIKDLKEQYTIPPKTKLEFTFDINLPDNAQPGDEWDVRFKVLEVSGGETENTGASLTQSVTDNFRVRVEEAPTSYTWLLWLGGAFIGIIIVIAIASKKSGGY